MIQPHSPGKRPRGSSVPVGRSLPPANGFISWQRLRRAILQLTSGTVVRWQPWFYLRLALLSRGLVLFRVIRGGIELSQRLVPQHHGLQGLLILTLDPERRRTDSSIARVHPPMARGSRPKTLRPLVVSVSRRRSFLLSSRWSARWRRACAPASGAPSPASCLSSANPRSNPGRAQDAHWR